MYTILSSFATPLVASRASSPFLYRMKGVFGSVYVFHVGFISHSTSKSKLYSAVSLKLSKNAAHGFLPMVIMMCASARFFRLGNSRSALSNTFPTI